MADNDEIEITKNGYHSVSYKPDGTKVTMHIRFTPGEPSPAQISFLRMWAEKMKARENMDRLRQCGKDGEMLMDYYGNKLTPTQLSVKYGCTVEQALRRVEFSKGYVLGERKDVSYDEWVRRQT